MIMLFCIRFFNNGRKVTSEFSKFSGVPKEDYYRLALRYAGGSFDDNSWVKGCTDVAESVVGNVLADYYYDKGCEVAQDVATRIAYSGKNIKDISVDEFYEMTKDIRKDVMSMDDNINDLYGDVEVGHAIGYCGDPCVKLSECFAGCFECGLLNSDDSGKLTAYLTEALSPIKSFRLSDDYIDSSLLFDNLDHGTMGAPHFCGYEISFDDRYYEFDRQAANAMRELCDSKSKEIETTVSRKTLHVPEVSEDDKDLEY